MRLIVASVGRLRAGPEADLVARYHARLRKIGPGLGFRAFDVVECPPARAADVTQRRAEEAEKLRRAVPDGARRVTLEETGAAMTSVQLAHWLAAARDAGISDTAFFVGGADGLDPGLCNAADLVLSLGRLTLPHQLAQVVLAEQLYRAATILGGHPYHRA